MKRMAGFLVFLLLVLVVLAGFLFTLNNDTPATLWFGRNFGPYSLGLWVLGAFVSGAVLGLVAGYGLWSKLRLRLEMRRLRRELEDERRSAQQLRDRLVSADPGHSDGQPGA